jgi:hypothetical protein
MLKSIFNLIITFLLLSNSPTSLLMAQQNHQVGVVLHLMADDYGVGRINESTARAAVDNVSEKFDVIDIDFFVVEVLEHNDSDFINVDASDLDDLMVMYNKYNSLYGQEYAINLYFTISTTGGGLATLPPSRANNLGLSFQKSGIVIENGKATTSTVPHEFGHYFGLYHTYEQRMGIEEPEGDPQDPENYPNPAYPNWQTAGDLLFDTKAEPDVAVSEYQWDEDCIFSGKGSFGGYSYLPGVQENSNNYMTGGGLNESCRTRFTSNQRGYMGGEFLTGERSDLKDQIWIQVLNEIDNEDAGGTYKVATKVFDSGDYFLYENPVDITTGQERLQTDDKHHDWNNVSDEYFLTLENFSGSASSTSQRARFEEMNTATIQNHYFTADLDGGSILFHDPWFFESDGSQPDDFIKFDSPYQPTGARDETSGGVFLDQGFPNWESPLYLVSASDTTIDGIDYFLESWTATNAQFQNAGASTTAVIFTDDNAVVTANMKGHLASNTSGAVLSNNQRKMVFDGSDYHMVYEDNGEIY